MATLNGWIYYIGYVFLTESEKQNNADQLYLYFKNTATQKMTTEAICGLLGNIERESALNPAMYEGGGGSGRGLIQWTPYTVLTNWCTKYGYTWYSGNVQCLRIECEGLGTKGASGYWIPTTNYPYSWEEFCNLTDVEEATKAYCYERERAGTVALDERITNAKRWFTYFTGYEPEPSPHPIGELNWYGVYREVLRRQLLI